jgi:hypothetical protein
MSRPDSTPLDETGAVGPPRLPITAFSALLGQSLRCHDVPGGPGVLFELLEVRDLGVREADGGPLSCYTLLFRHNGARGAVPQGLYRLEHETFGALEVFAVPVGPDGRGMRYEVIFN